MLISNRAGGTYQSLSEEEMKQFDGLGEDFDEPEVERESWKESGCNFLDILNLIVCLPNQRLCSLHFTLSKLFVQ